MWKKLQAYSHFCDYRNNSEHDWTTGMIMGAAGSTVYYNLRLRHPTLDLPLIDYDLALLFQPMLMLGISIGVAFNVIFADWMVTVLLILLFLGKFSHWISIICAPMQPFVRYNL